MQQIEMTGTWFVDTLTVVAGSPQMVTLLAAELRSLQHTLMTSDQILSLVDELKAKQDKFWEQNRRLKKIDLYLSRWGCNDEVAGLYLGIYGNLRFLLVKERPIF